MTWSLPAEFAGRTNAMLHRSRSFASVGGAPVDILTFDDFRDYSVLRGVLNEQGFLSEGTRIRNLWEDLPVMAALAWSRADQSLVPEGDKFTSFFPLSFQTIPKLVELEGPHKRLARYADDGKTLLQIDHFRSDGSLLLSDRHDADQFGVPGGRSLTLCDSAGVPIQDWGSAWGLYRSWLDYVAAGQQAYFVVDNKNTARFMASYQRNTAVVLYQVHESHLEDATEGFASEMTPSAQEVFPRLDAFDGVVFLTEQQASDVHKRYADVGSTYIIPNGRPIDSAPESTGTRSPRTGMHAAMLSHRKRVDHSVRAIHHANSLLPVPVGLKVFGDGSQRTQLKKLITDLHESDNVQLMGHVTNAQSHFREASFSLLTSTSEALPLVLPESMAAGCIPIVYDLPYGPASVITDGVDGFLVEYGNVEALGKCIAAFVELPPARQEEMRTAARRRAADFSDSKIVRLWVEAMKDAAERKRAEKTDYTVEIEDSSCFYESGGELEVGATLKLRLQEWTGQEDIPQFYCTLRIRPAEAFFRAAARSVTKDSAGTYSVGFAFDPEILAAIGRRKVDVYLGTRLGGATDVTRMPFADKKAIPGPYATAHGNMSINFRDLMRKRPQIRV
ncbi:glycosyltransferase [Pseudarthrobacter sp. MM222]|uniref:glycosyltransferase n=1 Tax=Pseudarthrobacter sp. MM222 TaxID=3018929 RepID=UPI00221E39BA|nr:glycosyltransferase [Pseudarthrobacter sp. MM222]